MSSFVSLAEELWDAIMAFLYIKRPIAATCRRLYQRYAMHTVIGRMRGHAHARRRTFRTSNAGGHNSYRDSCWCYRGCIVCKTPAPWGTANRHCVRVCAHDAAPCVAAEGHGALYFGAQPRTHRLRFGRRRRPDSRPRAAHHHAVCPATASHLFDHRSRGGRCPHRFRLRWIRAPSPRRGTPPSSGRSPIRSKFSTSDSVGPARTGR